MGYVSVLLLSLFFCHFLADYTHLSTNWMLSAKRIGKPHFPIFCHALIHASLMSVVVSYYAYSIKGIDVFAFKYDIVDTLFLIQLISHFCIDVLKSKMNVWFPALANPANKFHWWLFGADQFLHASVIILMTYLIAK